MPIQTRLRGLLHCCSDTGRGIAALPPLSNKYRLIAKYADGHVNTLRSEVLAKDVSENQVLWDAGVAPWQPGRGQGQPGWGCLIV